MNEIHKLFDFKLPALPEAAMKNDAYQDLASLFNTLRNLGTQVAQSNGIVQVPIAYRNVENLSITAGAKHRAYLTAGVDIPGYNLVNFYLDAGITKVRLADADNTTLPAHGMSGPAATATGDICEVLLPGSLIQGFVGLTIGTIYYTSTSAGLMQATNPATTGNLVQAVGVAITPTDLFMNLSYQIGVVV
jgi:hypothetical protein